jgi:hypothetical protein
MYGDPEFRRLNMMGALDQYTKTHEVFSANLYSTMNACHNTINQQQLLALGKLSQLQLINIIAFPTFNSMNRAILSDDDK